MYDDCSMIHHLVISSSKMIYKNRFKKNEITVVVGATDIYLLSAIKTYLPVFTDFYKKYIVI